MTVALQYSINILFYILIRVKTYYKTVALIWQCNIIVVKYKPCRMELGFDLIFDIKSISNTFKVHLQIIGFK